MNVKNYKRELIWITVAAVLFAWYYWRYRVPATLELDKMEVEVGPGQMSSLLEERKGAEVIHFYAHWCGPCIREIKMIAAEHARLKALGLDFVFVTDDTWERISQMQLILPPDIRIMRVTSLKDLGVYTIPATYIVNARNEVVFERIDACNWADSVFLQQIKTLLE